MLLVHKEFDKMQKCGRREISRKRIQTKTKSQRSQAVGERTAVDAEMRQKGNPQRPNLEIIGSPER